MLTKKEKAILKALIQEEKFKALSEGTNLGEIYFVTLSEIDSKII